MLCVAGLRRSLLNGRVSSVSSVSSVSKRSLMISPATNENTAHHFNPVLPFGFDFASDELREVLSGKFSVNVERLERKYNVSIQDDAEFNAPALPRQGSPLWGFVYANRLIKAKVQLTTLEKEEEFLVNYLRAQIEELEQRMKRYYPRLDWESEYQVQLDNAQSEIDADFENSKMESIGNLIASRDNAEDGENDYLSLFVNNSFVMDDEKFDDDDKFGDHLPSKLESKLTQWFTFYYDHSAGDSKQNENAQKYFSSIQKIEQMIETPLNALSKEMKQNFGLMVLDCFGNNNLGAISEMIAFWGKVSPLLVDSEGSESDSLLAKCLALLDVRSGQKLNQGSSNVLARLFLGSMEASKQLLGKDVKEVESILQSAGQERISLVCKALEIEKSLKNENVCRLFLTCLLRMNRSFMGQFLTDDGNIDEFGSSDNLSRIDKVVQSQKAFCESQLKLSNELTKFGDSVVNGVCQNKNLDKKVFSQFVENAIVNEMAPNASKCDENEACVIISSLRDYSQACRENGDFFGELEGLTFSKYLEFGKDKIFWYRLFHGIMNPPRNGISGQSLCRIADSVGNNTSQASSMLFGRIGMFLKEQGFLNEKENDSIENSLSSMVAKDWDSLKRACNDYNTSRIENGKALKSVSLNMKGNFHFDHIVDSYDPLNVHLSQFRYLTPN